ncbi:MAG: hypothetical protein QOD99_777 [Chthoniobacter sp.]|jgi:hypothetical protein|nr:hypothetical protein [Chthoniobacter sp.]
MARINIPQNIDDRLTLAEKMFAKHQADGASSPISGLGWAQVGPTIDPTQTLRSEAADFKKKSEQKNEQAGNALPPIDDIIRRARDILLGLYRDNPRKLEDWGFSVDDSPRGGSSSTPTPPAK